MLLQLALVICLQVPTPPHYEFKPFTVAELRKQLANVGSLQDSREAKRWWMHRALYRNDPQMVDMLLASGMDVNALLHGYKTIAYKNAYFSSKPGKNIETARVIIARGANVNIPETTYGLTPLMEAAKRDKPELAKLLLQAGAKPNVYSKRGETALYLALAKFHTVGGERDKKPSSVAIIDVLLDGGADPALRVGNTTGWHIAAYDRLVPIIRLMATRLKNRNVTDSLGRNALHVAALRRDSVNVIKLLLELGVDKLAHDGNEDRPLDISRRKGFDQIAKALS